jgi:hypothetical protein
MRLSHRTLNTIGLLLVREKSKVPIFVAANSGSEYPEIATGSTNGWGIPMVSMVPFPFGVRKNNSGYSMYIIIYLTINLHNKYRTFHTGSLRRLLALVLNDVFLFPLRRPDDASQPWLVWAIVAMVVLTAD